ncbi:hypothetical protein J1N35_035036 [Gossypium stocksii]|uniref:Uncharacterized protein n=1 Tax=Gossypium stocksii TaxID=47602 RepID=A0A9D3UT59_9ROSI|nr:hypothetical protein J1N35_035036 [Gossypium stocksii]
MLQVLDLTEKDALLTIQNGLKPWVRQELEQRSVQMLSEAMMVVESMVKFHLGKEEEDVVDGNGNGDNGGNGKP